MVLLPASAFGVAISLLLGVSWPGLIGGLALGVLLFTVPYLVVGALALWLMPSLADDSPRRMMLSLAVIGALAELSRLGLVTLLDADLVEAVWVGFGQQLVGLFIGIVPAVFFVLLRPPQIDQEQAAAGRAHPLSSARTLLWIGNLLVNIGFTLLVAHGPWLALVTVPAGAALASATLITGADKKEPADLRVELATLTGGIAATAVGLALFRSLGIGWT